MTSHALTDTTECTRFLERAEPFLAPFLIRHSLQLVRPVLYFGPDPKAAGHLFIAFFRSTSFQLKVGTVDGAAEVQVSPYSVDLNTSASGWLWPSQLKQSPFEGAPAPEELIALQASLNAGNVAWV